MTTTTRAAAAHLLRSLDLGDSVVVTQDGRDYTMTVSRAYQRADGAYGDPDGGNVVVTLGPGRWSTTVSAGRVADGYVALRREADPLMVDPEPGEVEPSDRPLTVRATVRRPDGDTFVIFAGEVPTWLWDDANTREAWKRVNRKHTLAAANIDPNARGYRVTYDAWDPQEANLV